MKNSYMLLAGILTFSLTCANADVKPKKMVPLGPVHSTNGMVLPQDAFVTSMKAIFIEKDKAYDGSSDIFDPKRRDISFQRYNAIFRYGFGNGLDFRVLVPYFRKNMSMFNPRARAGADFKNSGIGDTRAFLRYQLTSQQQGEGFFSAIDFGLELPTGEYDKNFYFRGRKLPNHNPLGVQLGDGSIDAILGLSATKIMKNHRVDGSIMYVYNTEGKNDFEKGDNFNYNVAYSYMVHPRFTASMELNGKYFGKNEYKGRVLNGTGGHELFATPGFGLVLAKGLKFFAGYSIPIYRNMEKGALGTKSLITAKLAYKW